MNKTNILVLGGTGFIGKKLVAKLNSSQPQINVLSWSSRDDVLAADFIASVVACNPEIIIVCSGKSFVPESWENPVSYYLINSLGTIKVAEAARLCNAKIVFLSTFVYGEPYILPISEDNTINPFNPYASSKLLAEQALMHSAKLFNVECNVLRLFNVFGSDQSPHFLIPSLIDQVKKLEKIYVKSLNPKRDYIHVDDVVDAIIAATLKFNGFQAYNVASGVSYSVQEIINILFKLSEINLPIISENIERPNEVFDTRADIKKIKKELNWEPKISLEDALKKMLK